MYPGESFGLKCNPSESELFQTIPISDSGTFTVFLYFVWCETVKNQSDAIVFILAKSKISIRMNTKQVFNSNKFELRFILIELLLNKIFGSILKYKWIANILDRYSIGSN